MWCKWQCRSMLIASDIEWRAESQLMEYPDTLAAMEARAVAIAEGRASELVWLLEHPPLYTAGTSADAAELLDPRCPVYSAGRGGRYTYHGPGQRIGYVMLNLGRRGRDVRCYVHALEGWVIAALGALGLTCWRAPGRIGIWTDDGGKEAKIGAIGVRIRRWVSFHGFAINLDPDLSHFSGIVPCGLAEFPVTSLARLGFATNRDALDSALFGTRDSFLAAVERPGEKICLSDSPI
jgi:lipoyl(octanoyl) transferase